MPDKQILNYIHTHAEEARQLLITLAQIPAPSNREEKRAAFCKEWLTARGLKDVHIDEALNVVCPIGVTSHNPLVVFMAHMDVVFPDMEPLPLTCSEDRICCPGVGDDTANLVCLMMAAGYLAESGAAERMEQKAAEGTLSHGLLLICNSGEEGLGNLKGSRRICEVYGSRIREFYSFDGTYPDLVTRAVGSKRMRITVRTIGGHSYGAFGNPNAIAQLAELIHELYRISVPPIGKTTYNVGTISGGTSVNTIAQEAEMLYEFRSDRPEGLQYMEEQFQSVIRAGQAQGMDITVETVGLRPCGTPSDPGTQERMIRLAADFTRMYTGKEPKLRPGSTDCNIPLSMGIPSVCLGCCDGEGAHTREEYVLTDSLLPGYQIAFAMILHYAAAEHTR